MKLYIHYPDVMTDEETKALQQLKDRQTKRIESGGVRKVEDKPVVAAKTVETVKKEEKKMRNPIDMYGQTINEGQYINYPVRNGSDTYMRTAKVIRVRQRNNHLDKPEMVLDVAVAIAPPAWERAKNKNWEQDVHVRRVTVSCPYRSTILPKEYIESDRRYKILSNI